MNESQTGPENRQAGRLYVVASPIGNLDDLTPRMRRALEAADLVAAEDTRRTGRLLEHLDLRRPLLSCHRFNEARSMRRLIEVLERGGTLALICDGGTPTISDPGHRLVAEAARLGHRVVPIPGPSAVIAALSVAGLPADRFYFGGFLPSRATARQRRIEAAAHLDVTVVFFEAPHRVLATLAEMESILGQRPLVLCRELTKLHEEILRGSAAEIRRALAPREKIRGEIVLVVAAGEGPAPREADAALREAYRAALDAEGGDRRRALRRLSRQLGRPRQELKEQLPEDG
ncbi:MAG: 16S rRNA (cytidine(1402)-2'-O)-methyltransferase [Acidobacteriota bacterium]|nr:16S rRNA (cytidine(1402)-2'-O)-methyltransferase [Acidobacteriota bacterium]